MCRLHRGLDGNYKLRDDRLQIHVVPHSLGEVGHRRLSIVSRPVETAIHQSLDPLTRGVEEGNGGQGGDGNADRRREREDPGDEGYQTNIDPDQ